jgi:hypothetical protein
MTPGFGLDQPQGQAGLSIQLTNRAGQGVSRRTRLMYDGNSGARQRAGELIGYVTSGFDILGGGVDRMQDDCRWIAAERNERWSRDEGFRE